MIHTCEEKRKHPRLRVKCPVSFIFSETLRIGETLDLSLGGMKIQSRYMLLRGETYDFTIVMNGRAINPKGKVVYIQNQSEFVYGTGVSFVNLGQDHQNRLSGFLSAQNS